MQAPFAYDDSALVLYLADLRASAAAVMPLSRQRETELSARIQAGDQEARDELVRANLTFVIQVARRYGHRGVPLSERISAGNAGLLVAAERFDGTKGLKFISYAVWWIRQSIVQAVSEHGRTIRLPLHKISRLAAFHRTSERLGQRWTRMPTRDEVAVGLGLRGEEIEDLLVSGRSTLSLDEPAWDDEDALNLLEMIPAPGQPPPDAEAVRGSARQELARVLTCLDDRELRVIRLYFGLDGHGGATLETIGGLIGVTRERVRQLKEHALAKLRHPSRGGALLDLVSELESDQDSP
ncbi:MAG: RNA polymerase sigma factor RpoD/SigA [Candidatus Latescibacterota bacterium]|jgi:RNA polymerase primary sigma factor